METYPGSIPHGEESAQMFSLNKRLEAYLSRVKALEEENQLLRAEIQHLHSTRADTSTVRKYHEEIMKLRDALDDGHRQMVQVEIDRDSIYEELEYVKELCHQERRAQEDAKKELSASKKRLDEETRAQTWLKERLGQLEQEMEDILAAHEEDKALLEQDISSYARRLDDFKVVPGNFTPVNVEDYADRLSQIWQGAVEDYQDQVSALEANLAQAKDNLKKVLDENKQGQQLLQNLDRDLQSLKVRKEMLENLLADQWMEQQEEEGQLQLEIESLEKEKQELRVQIGRVLEDRQQLMHLKMSLSLEVATYRSLLEAENTRLYPPSADHKISTSFNDSLLEQSSFRKGRHENIKALVPSDNRLKANKKPSAETSSSNRYLHVKSTSLSNRSSPVTKEFQKVSSVLQSQGLNYTKASSAKASTPLPPVESILGRHPQNGDVVKKKKVHFISYSQDSSKPVTKEITRKENDTEPVINANVYHTINTELKKTDRLSDAKSESESVQVESTLKTETNHIQVISDFGLEEQHFVGAQKKDIDTLVFEKPHKEITDLEVILPNDDHTSYGNIDGEDIIEKQEVIQTVSSQTVYAEREELVEPLEYHNNMESSIKVHDEEFRKVLDFSKPNTQDIDEPNVFGSDGGPEQGTEYPLSQELDFDIPVPFNADVDNASHGKEDTNQEAAEQKESWELTEGLKVNRTEETPNNVKADVNLQDEDVIINQKIQVLSSLKEDNDQLFNHGQNLTKDIYDEQESEVKEYHEDTEKDTEEVPQNTNIGEYIDNDLGQQPSGHDKDILDGPVSLESEIYQRSYDKLEHVQFDQEKQERFEFCDESRGHLTNEEDFKTQSKKEEEEGFEKDYESEENLNNAEQNLNDIMDREQSRILVVKEVYQSTNQIREDFEETPLQYQEEKDNFELSDVEQISQSYEVQHGSDTVKTSEETPQELNDNKQEESEDNKINNILDQLDSVQEEVSHLSEEILDSPLSDLKSVEQSDAEQEDHESCGDYSENKQVIQTTEREGHALPDNLPDLKQEEIHNLVQKENVISNEEFDIQIFDNIKKTAEAQIVLSTPEQTIQASESQQYVGFSLNIISNNLRFTSENDGEAEAEQDKKSNVTDEEAETHKDEIILEEQEGEHDILEKEIICQQSIIVLEHERENLLLEDTKSQVLLAENPTDNDDVDGSTEKNLRELDDIEEANNPDNENLISEDSIDISIYSQKSDEFEISKDYQLEQTLPDTTPLPNLDEFEDLVDDEIITEESAEVTKSQCPAGDGEAEEALDSSLESQSSQILPEVSDQSNVTKDSDYSEQQDQSPIDVIESEHPEHFVDHKLDSSAEHFTEEPTSELAEDPSERKTDDENTESAYSVDPKQEKEVATKSKSLSDDGEGEEVLDSSSESHALLPEVGEQVHLIQHDGKDSDYEQNDESPIELVESEHPEEFIDPKLHTEDSPTTLVTEEVIEPQSPTDGGEAEEVSDSNVQSQSQIFPEVSEQPNLIKHDDKVSEYYEQDESSIDLVESEHSEHIIDSKLETENSSTILVTEEPAPELSEHPIESTVDDENTKSEYLAYSKLDTEETSTTTDTEEATRSQSLAESGEAKEVLDSIVESQSSQILLEEGETPTDRVESEQLEHREDPKVDTENYSAALVTEEPVSETFENLVESKIVDEKTQSKDLVDPKLDTEESSTTTDTEEVNKSQSPAEVGEAEEVLDSSLESQSSEKLLEEGETPTDQVESEHLEHFVDHKEDTEDSSAALVTEEPVSETSEDQGESKIDEEKTQSEDLVDPKLDTEESQSSQILFEEGETPTDQVESEHLEHVVDTKVDTEASSTALITEESASEAFEDQAERQIVHEKSQSEDLVDPKLDTEESSTTADNEDVTISHSPEEVGEAEEVLDSSVELQSSQILLEEGETPTDQVESNELEHSEEPEVDTEASSAALVTEEPASETSKDILENKILNEKTKSEEPDSEDLSTALVTEEPVSETFEYPVESKIDDEKTKSEDLVDPQLDTEESSETADNEEVTRSQSPAEVGVAEEVLDSSLESKSSQILLEKSETHTDQVESEHPEHFEEPKIDTEDSSTALVAEETRFETFADLVETKKDDENIQSEDLVDLKLNTEESSPTADNEEVTKSHSPAEIDNSLESQSSQVLFEEGETPTDRIENEQREDSSTGIFTEEPASEEPTTDQVENEYPEHFVDPKVDTEDSATAVLTEEPASKEPTTDKVESDYPEHVVDSKVDNEDSLAALVTEKPVSETFSDIVGSKIDEEKTQSEDIVDPKLDIEESSTTADTEEVTKSQSFAEDGEVEEVLDSNLESQSSEKLLKEGETLTDQVESEQLEHFIQPKVDTEASSAALVTEEPVSEAFEDPIESKIYEEKTQSEGLVDPKLNTEDTEEVTKSQSPAENGEAEKEIDDILESQSSQILYKEGETPTDRIESEQQEHFVDPKLNTEDSSTAVLTEEPASEEPTTDQVESEYPEHVVDSEDLAALVTEEPVSETFEGLVESKIVDEKTQSEDLVDPKLDTEESSTTEDTEEITKSQSLAEDGEAEEVLDSSVESQASQILLEEGETKDQVESDQVEHFVDHKVDIEASSTALVTEEPASEDSTGSLVAEEPASEDSTGSLVTEEPASEDSTGSLITEEPASEDSTRSLVTEEPVSETYLVDTKIDDEKTQSEDPVDPKLDTEESSTTADNEEVAKSQSPAEVGEAEVVLDSSLESQSSQILLEEGETPTNQVKSEQLEHVVNAKVDTEVYSATLVSEEPGFEDCTGSLVTEEPASETFEDQGESKKDDEKTKPEDFVDSKLDTEESSTTADTEEATKAHSPSEVGEAEEVLDSSVESQSSQILLEGETFTDKIESEHPGHFEEPKVDTEDSSTSLVAEELVSKTFADIVESKLDDENTQFEDLVDPKLDTEESSTADTEEVTTSQSLAEGGEAKELLKSSIESQSSEILLEEGETPTDRVESEHPGHFVDSKVDTEDSSADFVTEELVSETLVTEEPLSEDSTVSLVTEEPASEDSTGPLVTKEPASEDSTGPLVTEEPVPEDSTGPLVTEEPASEDSTGSLVTEEPASEDSTGPLVTEEPASEDSTVSLVTEEPVSEDSTGPLVTEEPASEDSTGSLVTEEPASEDSTGSLVTEEPVSEDSTGSLVTEEPASEDSTGSLVTEEPASEDSTVSLVTEEPVSEDSTGPLVTEEPASEDSTGSLVTEEPASEDSTGSLVTEEPVSEDSTGSLVTEEPASEDSTGSLVTEEPASIDSTGSLVTEEPASEDSTVSLVTEEPASEDSTGPLVTEEPMSEDSTGPLVTEEPASEDFTVSLVTEEPVSEDSTGSLVTEEPASKDSTGSLVTEEPASEDSTGSLVTEEPASEDSTGSLVTEEPASEDSTGPLVTEEPAPEDSTGSLVTEEPASEDSTGSLVTEEPSSEDSTGSLVTEEPASEDSTGSLVTEEPASENYFAAQVTEEPVSEKFKDQGESKIVDEKTQSEDLVDPKLDTEESSTTTDNEEVTKSQSIAESSKAEEVLDSSLESQSSQILLEEGEIPTNWVESEHPGHFVDSKLDTEDSATTVDTEDVTDSQSPTDEGEAKEVSVSSLESKSSQILSEVSEQPKLIKDSEYYKQHNKSSMNQVGSQHPEHFVEPKMDAEDPSTTLVTEEPPPKLFEEPSESNEQSSTNQKEIEQFSSKVELEASKDSQVEKAEFDTSPPEDQEHLSSKQLDKESVNDDNNGKHEEKRAILSEDTNTENLSEPTELVHFPSQENITENEEYITMKHSDLVTQDFSLEQRENVDTEDHKIDLYREKDKEGHGDSTEGAKEPSTEHLEDFNEDNVISSNVPNNEECEIQGGRTLGTDQDDVQAGETPSEESSESDGSIVSGESSLNVSTISPALEQEYSKTQLSVKEDINVDTDSKSPKEPDQNDPLLTPEPEGSLTEQIEPQTSSDEEKGIASERSDTSYDSSREHDNMSEYTREYSEDGINGQTIVQATLDLEGHMYNGHSTEQDSKIIISEAKIIRSDGDIVKSQSQDKIEESLIEFTVSEGKSEGFFQSLIETSEASEIKNNIQTAVTYVDSDGAQSTYTKKVINPYLSERDLGDPSEITPADLVDTNQGISDTNQGLKIIQKQEDSWSSDE